MRCAAGLWSRLLPPVVLVLVECECPARHGERALPIVAGVRGIAVRHRAISRTVRTRRYCNPRRVAGRRPPAGAAGGYADAACAGRRFNLLTVWRDRVRADEWRLRHSESLTGDRHRPRSCTVDIRQHQIRDPAVTTS